MTKPNKQIAPRPGKDDEDEILSSVDTVSSSMECTGLIQRPPASEAEADSYADLYTIPKPAKKEEKKSRNKKSETERR